MKFDFSAQFLPPVYKRQGRACYLDPIREKLIYITPEETVRQQVISWLLYDRKVPADMLRVEAPLKHYGSKSTGRADIIIHMYDSNTKLLEPLCVIECKAPGVMLDTAVHEQMISYCDGLECDYGVVTNGSDLFCYHYDAKRDAYDMIESLPKYLKMLNGAYVVAPEEEIPPRLKHEEIPLQWDAYLGADMGADTPEKLMIPLVNLWECLVYEEHKLPVGDYGVFSVVQDIGIRLLSYGNAAGGAFQGAYRSFMIQYQGSTEIVSIGMSPYGRTDNPNSSKTAICVAIDNEESAHHALQLVADDNLTMVGKDMYFYHHGKIAIGKLGSGKVEELRQFVAEQAPELLQGNRFYLGKLTDDRLWNLDDAEVQHVICNFITYALVRDEYRKFVKRQL